MNKLMITLVASIAMTFAGCDLSETQLVSTANMSGNLAMLGWFSVDNPDDEVKVVLKEVVSNVTTASVQIAEGKTYLDSLLPQVQAFALKQEKLNDYQKTLISAGAVVILNGLDTLIASNESLKTNAELVSKVVSAFGKGALTVLNMSSDTKEIRRARAVYMSRSMRCRGGKFSVEIHQNR